MKDCVVVAVVALPFAGNTLLLFDEGACCSVAAGGRSGGMFDVDWGGGVGPALEVVGVLLRLDEEPVSDVVVDVLLLLLDCLLRLQNANNTLMNYIM